MPLSHSISYLRKSTETADAMPPSEKTSPTYQ